ncbi:PGAM-domain-containing protein [Sodiomyces alkalinus F11]|uniref:PGAM-domain-containing protein n=1 Tax=Sodiomyces alkalinus (strain CBS 110278 / VKM F-3762 / F11) TaxID=1314773 RepID=A0A3N2PMH6_SODAK|nr:PGAM-domain-containing protein [Sodiomyces alkalinus F11]ROT35713.1 PGAM-domain-containing protein [Sodiomyces alkalinus F11]
MSLEVIYLVRHGFRSNWLVDHVTGNYSSSVPSPTGISADPALTAHGVDQANELAAHLLTVDPAIEAVYSSPYYRCLQTISPFVERKAQEHQSLQQQRGTGASRDQDTPQSAVTTIRPELGISEWYGAAHFEHPTPAPGPVLKSMFPHYDEKYQSEVVPARKGETIQELYQRVAKAAAAIIDQCDAEGRRAVILCSHAAPIIALSRVLTGQVPENPETHDFDAFTCGLGVFRRKRNPDLSEAEAQNASRQGTDSESWKLGTGVRGGWTCEANSDCSFLSGGEERGWRFSGDESFPAANPSSQADAGIALGVVVEGRQRGAQDRQQPRAPRDGNAAAGGHHL